MRIVPQLFAFLHFILSKTQNCFSFFLSDFLIFGFYHFLFLFLRCRMRVLCTTKKWDTIACEKIKKILEGISSNMKHCLVQHNNTLHNNTLHYTTQWYNTTQHFTQYVILHIWAYFYYNICTRGWAYMPYPVYILMRKIHRK